MSEYIAANGQVITDALIDQWCEAYERGEFPEGRAHGRRRGHGPSPLCPWRRRCPSPSRCRSA